MTKPNPSESSDSPRILGGVPKSAEALAIAQLLSEGKTHCLIHITTSDRELDRLATALSFFAPDADVIRFPAWDAMPYDRSSPHASIMAERMQALATLTEGSDAKRVVLTTVNAVIQRLPPKDALEGVTLTLAAGSDYPRDALLEALVKQGYRRAGKAMEPGEFALRGSLVDLMPPGLGHGLRIDFMGDTIETIKPYDPFTQVTQGSVPSLSLYPASEVLLNDETLKRFRERYRDRFGAVTKDDPLYETISNGGAYPGMEHWLPLFYEDTATLFDYCKGALVTQSGDAEAAFEERWESIQDYYGARTEALGAKKNNFNAAPIYHPLPPEDAFLMPANWEQRMRQVEHIAFSPLAGPNAAPMRALAPTAPLPPFEQLSSRVTAAAQQGKTTLLACFTNGSRERMQSLLLEHGFHAVRIERWDELPKVSGKTVALAILPIETGFETDKALILSEQDVLGERIVRAIAKKKKSDVFMAEAANFTEGELVVHKEHGIGRFEGLITLTVSGAAHDCLKLIYEGGDKLFLPVENIELVTRYGEEDENARLDKLGGASWQARKAKLKERILMSAEALLKTAAERTLKKGSIIDVPAGSYDDFCSRFPYMETEDQARAIDEVLEDLHRGRPMDRLVCGDVGFGKTEVALRAAFVVACNQERKMQVALIAPTTLLARQHYKNFKQRFEGFPVTIRQLSRIVPARAQKETREQLAAGEVDIVIGTHALLSKQVAFKNLGLLIVDEEQHFGVAQKEKLKELKSDIHVLTLSATPIPRTLQMALTGVRDLSLITTPPVDRLAIRSFVMPLDPVVIREALMREMHRGGKSFVVCPRIKNIAEVKAHLVEIVPEAKLAVAHGQMPPSELDKIMNDFYDGKYDVLLSTAIIESGLDVEAANTMIIHNAHLFGLSQLYQLRGRVGRGKTRAYAYFLLPHHKLLTRNATRRLEVMQTLDTLGAGFTLASHDMDIRGFGNLVGEEQSGHIREVGIELYQQMLEEAVEQLKHARDGEVAAAASTDWSPQINLGLPVLIPESYVEDLSLRLGLYRRAAHLETDAEIDSFAAELVDRFGPLPEETKTLIATLSLKILCKKAGIERLDIGPKGAVISFKDNLFANPEALLEHVSKNRRTLKIRPDQKLVFIHEWMKKEDVLGTVKQLAAGIALLADAPKTQP